MRRGATHFATYETIVTSGHATYTSRFIKSVQAKKTNYI
jgi:hypothetical protein